MLKRQTCLWNLTAATLGGGDVGSEQQRSQTQPGAEHLDQEVEEGGRWKRERDSIPAGEEGDNTETSAPRKSEDSVSPPSGPRGRPGQI